MRRIRCAIYTRKSSEEGLEQEFNSLDAQREACEAYIASQRHEGWELLDRRYDDGGISGGHLDRPALQQLMRDVDDRHVNQIVVYKIDRLTRSLADFSKLVDRLDRADASFVSVTQSFNTGTSMGRLTLNVLLSFAQFEREVTAERIRDKIAASKQKGLWMGGNIPLGYDADGRILKVNTEEAEAIKVLFDLYETHGALNVVTSKAAEAGVRSRKRQSRSGQWRGGNVLSRGHVHHILTNPIYAGRIPHKGRVYEGQHEAIIDTERWERVQMQLAQKAPVISNGHIRKTEPSPLTGRLFDERGMRLAPSHTRKNGERYRYYVSRDLVTGRKDDSRSRGWRLPADKLEAFVQQAVQCHLRGNANEWIAQSRNVEAHRHLQRQMNDQGWVLETIERIVIGEGKLSVRLKPEPIMTRLELSDVSIDVSALTFDTTFTMRRRGVEARFVSGDTATERDASLIANIARATQWLEWIKSGKTLDEVADAESTTKKRVQQTLNFAFLAPDIVRDVLAGRQPIGLTSTWVATHELPTDWKEQRSLIGRL